MLPWQSLCIVRLFSALWTHSCWRVCIESEIWLPLAPAQPLLKLVCACICPHSGCDRYLRTRRGRKDPKALVYRGRRWMQWSWGSLLGEGGEEKSGLGIWGISARDDCWNHFWEKSHESLTCSLMSTGWGPFPEEGPFWISGREHHTNVCKESIGKWNVSL